MYYFIDVIVKKIHNIVETKDDLLEIIELPKEQGKGDIALPCFFLAKQLKKNPNEIAHFLEEEFSKDDQTKELFDIEVVGPYVNFFVKTPQLIKSLMTPFQIDESNKDKTIIVEYSSPNIAKPFHIGHIRSTVIGSALANFYSYLGYKVIRMNYLGDYGTQFGKMIVAYKKWGSKQEVEDAPIKTLLKYYTKFHDESQNDESLEQEARDVFYNLEQGCEEEVNLWKWFKEESLKEFKRVYDLLGIDFDDWSSESKYTNELDGVNDLLEKKKLLVESEGALVVDLEKFNMPPALIRKKDGASLYITRDLAAVIDRKKEYDFDECLYVVASQQNLHFEQIKKIIELLDLGFHDGIVHIPFGLVALEGGKTMSTRKGEVVFLEDVLLEAIDKTKTIIKNKGSYDGDIDKLAKEIGVGAVIFNELSADRIKDYTFSFDKVLNFEGETGPYVQYTYARLCSVLNKKSFDIDSICVENLTVNEEAVPVLRTLLLFDTIIEKTRKTNEIAHISRFVLKLAKAINRFYHNNQILVEDEQQMNFNLLVCELVREKIKTCVDIIGITAPSRM